MKKFLLILVIVAVAAGIWVKKHPNSYKPVEVVRPTKGEAVHAVYATGTVEATIMMPISSRNTARLIRLDADEGQDVKKDQVLGQLEDDDLQSSITELKAKADYAQKDYERKKSLLSSGYQTKAVVDQALADLNAAKAAVSRAQAQTNFMKLTSPADGRIIKRDGEIGQVIPANQPVFWISCCAPLRISAEVDEEDIAQVHPGQDVLIRADAFPDKVFSGKVKSITPKGDPVSRSYRVRIEFSEPTPLQIGMTAETNIVVSKVPDAILVPTTALVKDGLWVVKDSTLSLVKVQTGARGDENTEVLNGITLQDEVVLNPDASFKEGKKIKTVLKNDASTN